MNKLKKVIVFLIIIGILGSAGLFGWQQYQQKGTAPVKVYRFDMVGMTEFWGDTRESYGPVSTDKIQTIFLTDTQTVSEIKVKEGQQVKKGDLLMSYDTTLSQLELEKKGLEIEKAELDLADEQKELQRISWMVPMRLPPEEPETEPTEPDMGWQLGNSYYTFLGWGRDGGSPQDAFITWIRPDTILSDDLLMDIGDALQKYLDEKNKPTDPTEEPTEETEESTEEASEESTEVPSEEETETPTDETQTVPTDAPTNPSEEVPTEEPATEEPSSEAPTEETTQTEETEETTEVPSEAATEETEAETEAPTETQTEVPTEIQTEAPEEAEPEAPVETPVEVQTEAPVETPVEVQTEAPAAEAEAAGITGEELLVMYADMENEESEATQAPEIEPETEAATEPEATVETMDVPAESIDVPSEPLESTEQTEATESTDSTDSTESTEPTAPTEPKPKPQKNRTSIPYYTILRITQDNMSLGYPILWLGIHVRSDGSFTFFSADEIGDYTLPEPEEETTDPYVDYFGSGYTYSDIQKMKEEQQVKIKDVELKLKMAQAEYRIMERELSDGNVYAEIDGKILSVLSEEDAKLNQLPVIKLSGGGGFYIEASISELERSSMSIGQKVTVNDWETGMTYDGEVVSIGDIPSGSGGYNGMDNPNASSYPFSVFVDETADLKAGSYASVQYAAASSQNGVYLQKPFIRTIQDKSIVYVMGADGLLEERVVTTGKSVWGSYTEILDGVTADDLIAFPYGKNVRPGVPAEEGDMQDLYGNY